MAKTLLLILNPRAGRTRSTAPLFDAVAYFCEAGYLVSVRRTTHPGHAAADDAVEVRPLRLHDLGGVAGVGGPADGYQIPLLAEMGHRVEQRGRGTGAPRPGIDDQQKGLCHSGLIPRIL